MKRLLHLIHHSGSKLLLLLLCACFGTSAMANNIRIFGIPVMREADKDTVQNTVKIRFDIAWDNSWYSSKPANHDAAWIFVKCWDGESWNHVYLEATGKQAGSTSAAEAANPGAVDYYVSNRDGTITNMPMVLEPGYSKAYKKWHLDPDEVSQQCVVGYFLHRESFGAGDVVVPGVYFTWNYGNQGFVDEDDLVVKVFAVEMVYVPQGAYYLGGTGTVGWQEGSFTCKNAEFGYPYHVSSEDEITVASDADATHLWAYQNAITAGTIPAAFPKGYQAFYIMKYEMSQEAYCEFLNTLTQAQQDGRINGTLADLGVNAWAWGGDLSSWRNFIKIKQAAPVVIFAMDVNNNGTFNQTDKVVYRADKPGSNNDTLVRNIDAQDLAVNAISAYDLFAYAEFAGLRPMTELEYEKACRGTREPVNDEYAWGSVTMRFYSKNGWQGITDAYTGTEHVGDSYNVGFAAYYSHWGTWWTWYGTMHCGPLRVGIFADSTSTRAASGATFWGVMNMSDNVAEICISTYDENGRKFEGVHGSGQLDGNGDAQVEGWHIVNVARYNIVRGMYMTYYDNWQGKNGRFGIDEIYPGYYTTASHAYYRAGMVSSRYLWASGGWLPANRYVANPMQGIRCVRTANATE